MGCERGEIARHGDVENLHPFVPRLPPALRSPLVRQIPLDAEDDVAGKSSGHRLQKRLLVRAVDRLPEDDAVEARPMSCSVGGESTIAFMRLIGHRSAEQRIRGPTRPGTP